MSEPATQSNIDAILAAYDAEKTHLTVGAAMNAVFGVGNVDLLNRPQIPTTALSAAGWTDVGTGTATVFSVAYDAGTSGVPYTRNLILHMTPIMPYGDVKSPSAMEDYVDELLKKSNIPSIVNADKPNYGGDGILLWVQPVDGTWSSAYTISDQFDEDLHLLQAAFYLDEFTGLPTSTELRGLYNITHSTGGHGSASWPEYKYSMGFKINGEPIPDPMVFTGKESDLDTMGERDATGYLHRNMVATKYPVKLGYKAIPWDLLMDICAKINGPKFNFTFPSPYTGGMETIEAYAGDRDFEAVSAMDNGQWLANLNFSVIQY